MHLPEFGLLERVGQEKKSEGKDSNREKAIQCTREAGWDKHAAGEGAGLRTTSLLETLRREGRLTPEVERVKSIFSKQLGEYAATFGEDCWELLTLMDLYDEETAQHCVETFVLARDKVTNALWNGTVLAEEISQEGVSPEQFYRACLLHDVGKLEVPHAVLTNRVSSQESAAILLREKNTILRPWLQERFGTTEELTDDATDPVQLEAFLFRKYKLRPNDITPVRLLLGEPLSDALLQQLAFHKHGPQDSLRQIMSKHDQYSRAILLAQGYDIEGKLAGSHHQSRVEEGAVCRISIGAIQVSVDLADIIHLADVTQAVENRRPYKEARSRLDALQELTLHSRFGLVDKMVAYLWVADEVYRLREKTIESDEEQSKMDVLQDYLRSEYEEHPDWPDWQRNSKGA